MEASKAVQAKKVPLTLYNVIEVCKEAGLHVDLDELYSLVQHTVPAVQQPQAFVSSLKEAKLGFFRLSPHVDHSQFKVILEYINVPEKQTMLGLKEELNKNGKHICEVSVDGNILGYLSGYKEETLIAISVGEAIFTNAEPVKDVSSWLI